LEDDVVVAFAVDVLVFFDVDGADFVLVEAVTVWLLPPPVVVLTVGPCAAAWPPPVALGPCACAVGGVAFGPACVLLPPVGACPPPCTFGAEVVVVVTLGPCPCPFWAETIVLAPNVKAVAIAMATVERCMDPPCALAGRACLGAKGIPRPPLRTNAEGSET
jgi:hypothetical protein